MISFYKYDAHIGVAGDDYGDWGTMTFRYDGEEGVTGILMVEVWNNPACVHMSLDGENFGDDIEFDPDNPPIPLPFACRAIEIRNRDAGAAAIFQITGYW